MKKHQMRNKLKIREKLNAISVIFFIIVIFAGVIYTANSHEESKNTVNNSQESENLTLEEKEYYENLPSDYFYSPTESTPNSIIGLVELSRINISQFKEGVKLYYKGKYISGHNRVLEPWTYDYLIFMAIKAAQEQQKEIESLRNQLNKICINNPDLCN